MKRRGFIKKTMQTGAALSFPWSVSGFHLKARRKLRIGMVADVHQDIIHDGYARLRFFIDDMKKRKPDFIIQMGDFALPRKRNQPFLDAWNEFEGPRYHVLGNHDMKDFGFTKEQTMDWWQMERRYYAFDQGDFHFIVLDGNEQNPEPWTAYYPRYIGSGQQEWLKKDLEKTSKPTIVFSHQSLETPEGGVANNAEIRKILEGQKNASGQTKVIACLSGHHHTDYVKEIGGIPYIQINSMSYKWVGSKFEYQRFSAHVEQAYPAVSKTCPYKDPLYTVFTLDPSAGTMHLEGRKTSFISPTPKEIGVPNAESMLPSITERKLPLPQ
ncbi:MAG: metallophosphoesterase [Cytophagales bacterium]|nr:metallophosphoesterase [Cytophagales bacterium]